MTTYTLAPDCPPLAAKGMVTFHVAPADLSQLARWLDGLAFIQLAPAHETEHSRWRTMDHTGLLVVWRSGTLLCQGAKPTQLASLLRAQIRDTQLTLFDLSEALP